MQGIERRKSSLFRDLDLNGYTVFHTRVGQTIQITVLRDGKRAVVSLALGARP